MAAAAAELVKAEVGVAVAEAVRDALGLVAAAAEVAAAVRDALGLVAEAEAVAAAVKARWATVVAEVVAAVAGLASCRDSSLRRPWACSQMKQQVVAVQRKNPPRVARDFWCGRGWRGDTASAMHISSIRWVMMISINSSAHTLWILMVIFNPPR